MNVFHKSKKGVALFVLIMFLCTMMPFSAFAAEPSDTAVIPMAENGGPGIDGFKYMKINSGRAYYNASTCMMKDMKNWYYNTISLNDIGILSFAIQITQPVDLKVYKANNDYCTDDGINLKGELQLGGDYEDQFCGEFIGYIEGYEIAGANFDKLESEEQFQQLVLCWFVKHVLQSERQNYGAHH